jgi:hypothetical protein
MLRQHVNVRGELGVFRKVEAVALGDEQGEAQQDVGGGELRAAEVGAVVGRGLELRVEEAEVVVVVGEEVGVVDAAGDGAGDGFDEEGLRGVFDLCGRKKKGADVSFVSVVVAAAATLVVLGRCDSRSMNNLTINKLIRLPSA